MIKIMIFIISVVVVILVIKAIIGSKICTEDRSYNLDEKIFNFLQSNENRKYIYSKAVKRNKGNSSNTCVYFLAELLRENNFMVPNETKKVSEVLKMLKEDGWKKHSNYEELKPGDICFTTDSDGNKDGIPTHTYVFMKWVKEGSYDFAYVCDNQAKDYNGRLYHIRNIRNVEKTNGFKKEAFAFFMKKS
ncbi:hypothetical protein [Clostridium cibarium]|uniref:Bacteriophage peptidoglycan hydrolase n=1 Tax=Clostridium cibarium TaxID=2762247 RepID=A0ABR8PXK7_9CLOT|nr:hypothetical protein [Clostridium cibarium]